MKTPAEAREIMLLMGIAGIIVPIPLRMILNHLDLQPLILLLIILQMIWVVFWLGPLLIRLILQLIEIWITGVIGK